MFCEVLFCLFFHPCGVLPNDSTTAKINMLLSPKLLLLLCPLQVTESTLCCIIQTSDEDVKQYWCQYCPLGYTTSCWPPATDHYSFLQFSVNTNSLPVQPVHHHLLYEDLWNTVLGALLKSRLTIHTGLPLSTDWLNLYKSSRWVQNQFHQFKHPLKFSGD